MYERAKIRIPEETSDNKKPGQHDRAGKRCYRYLESLTEAQILQHLEGSEAELDLIAARIASGKGLVWFFLKTQRAFYPHEVVWAFQQGPTELIRWRAKSVLWEIETLAPQFDAIQERERAEYEALRSAPASRPRQKVR